MLFLRSDQLDSEFIEGSYKGCEPRKKVAFLKTHKCASTSIQNIFLRFGKNNHLNFVLPMKGTILGNKASLKNMWNNVPFHRSMIKGTLWEKAKLDYHMFLVHARWNLPEISKILNDHGDVIYVSILRDPVELFRSWWDYLRLDKRYNQTIENYAMTGKNEKLESKKGFEKRPYGFNQMLFDFGMDFEDMKDKEIIERKIVDIDETFDIILIADDDSFDDSIVLLKDA